MAPRTKSKAGSADVPFAVPDWPAARPPEMVKVSAITPHPKNPRTHPDAQVDGLGAAYDEFGVVVPPIVDENYRLMAGEGRWLAAQKKNFAELPCIVVRGWSEKKKLRFMLADNRLPQLGGYDDALMREVLGLVKDEGLLAAIGYDDAALAAAMANPNGTGNDPEKVPQRPKKPVVQIGDIWTLGSHLLLCGDSTKEADVTRACAGLKPTTTVTDPPYGIDYQYGEHDDDKKKNDQLVRDVFAIAPAEKIWTPGKMNLARELVAYPEAKILAWHKKFAQAGSGLGGASTWEPVLVVGIKKGRLPDDYLPFPTEREESPLDSKKMLRDEHPCPKPVALFEHLLKYLTRAGASIYEPFCGSGTTLIAAERTGRRCAAIEKDPNYVEVTIIRWQNYTGKVATNADGESFADVKKRGSRKTRATSR